MSRSTGDTTRNGGPRRWAMRDIVLGVVFGFLYWALVQGWLVLSVATGRSVI